MVFNGNLIIMGSVTSQNTTSALFTLFIGHLKFARNGLWWTNLNEYALDMTNTSIKLYTSSIILGFFMFVEHLCYIGVLHDQCKDSRKTSIMFYTSFLPFVFFMFVECFC